MVERYKRSRGKRQLLGNHQKCWIWGRNTVLETLRAGNWSIHELWIDQDMRDDVDEAQELAAAAEIAVHFAESGRLREKCHSSEHQGFLAKMSPFPYGDAESLLNSGERQLLLVCDRIQDPFNFGAVIRSAEVLGATAVVTADSQQVGVTSLVARTSAGAVNHIPIVRTSLAPFLNRCREAGIRVVGLDMDGDVNSFSARLDGSVAIVVGNEGRGISAELRALCDHICEIPQSGQVDSLNAAVAVSILLHEAQRQNAT